MKHDLKNNLEISQTISPDSYADDATGDGVELENGNSCLVVLDVGDYGDGSHEFTIEESSDNSTYTEVAAAKLEGSLPTVDAESDEGIHTVGVYSDEKYLRVVAAETDETGGTTYGVSVILGDLRYAGENVAEA